VFQTFFTCFVSDPTVEYQILYPSPEAETEVVQRRLRRLELRDERNAEAVAWCGSGAVGEGGWWQLRRSGGERVCDGWWAESNGGYPGKAGPTKAEQ
jgi:hypothetical protein